MYKIGEVIHHANRGLCQVEEITSMKASRSEPEKQYYKLVPLGSNGSAIFTPVENPKVKMRRILSKEDAQKLIRDLPSIALLPVDDEKKIEQMCREAMLSIDCRDWIGLIKTLYERRCRRLDAGKKVAASEERYFQSATERLHTELAMAIGIEPDQVIPYIEERIK